MDRFAHLAILLAIVLVPLLLMKWRTAFSWLTSHGVEMLDYLDKVSAPLPLRIVLRWTVAPLAWLATQIGDKQNALDRIGDVGGQIDDLDPTEEIDDILNERGEE